MKKCPYCAEEIQDEAIRCRYCGSDLAPEAVAAVSQSLAPSSDSVQAPVEFRTGGESKPWHHQTWAYVFWFIFLFPVWSILKLTDDHARTITKILAVVLLLPFLASVLVVFLALTPGGIDTTMSFLEGTSTPTTSGVQTLTSIPTSTPVYKTMTVNEANDLATAISKGPPGPGTPRVGTPPSYGD